MCFSQFDKLKGLLILLNIIRNMKAAYHIHSYLFKLINKSTLLKCRTILKEIEHIEFIDENQINDYEFKTMERAAYHYPDYLILFLISHCQPNKKNWLKIICDSYENNSFIGITGSNESMYTSLKFKKIWKFIYNFKNFYFFKKNFKPFPNPHIRLPAFFLHQKDFLEFVKNKNYQNKKDAWITEAGKEGMTNFFKEKNYKIYLINSNSNKFYLDNMKASETYCFKNQDKLLISDRHTRKYDLLTQLEKDNMIEKIWGNI